jgi:ketosteroid isomerase-like protein
MQDITLTMFRNHVLILTAVSLAVLTGCSQAIDHRQALIDTREACGVAIASGDTGRIFSCWTEDVVIYPVSEPAVKGIDAVKAYVFRNRQELGIRPKLNPLEFAASVSGDLGYIIGTHEWINREGQATMPGRYVTLWRKNEQGEWKCFLEIHSPRSAEDVENVMSNHEASGTLQP